MPTAAKKTARHAPSRRVPKRTQARKQRRSEDRNLGPFSLVAPTTTAQRVGSLIVVEGVDGSGKSTQLELVGNWLKSNGFAVVTTTWTSSETVKPLIKTIKKGPILVTPEVFSLMYVADLAERYETIIRGALKAGMIVLCDRYVYTALARDTARGLKESFVESAYAFAPRPDIAFYFRVSPELALSRKSSMPNFYEAGMDLGLSRNPKVAFDLFQRRVIQQYDAMAERCGMTIINGENPIYKTFPVVKAHVASFINKKYGIHLA